MEHTSIQLRGADRGGLLRRNLGWTLFLLMLAVFVSGRFVGPRVPDDQQKRWCAVNVHITAMLGVSLNCDAPAFMLDATHPSALLERNDSLQTRPGMPLVAWIAALPFRPLNALVPRLAGDVRRADIESSRVDNALKSFGPSYVAYFLLNMLILSCSFYLFRRLLQAGRPDRADETAAVISVSVATLFIATYPITNFVLSPHTQMFNTLVPLLAVACALRAKVGALMEVRFAATVGALVGLGMTAYALFCMITATVLVFAGLHALRDRPRSFSATLVRNAAILVLLSLIPTALWYLFVRETTGEFYVNEVTRSNSLVWIVTALQNGPSDLLHEFLHRLRFHVVGVISLLPSIVLMSVLTGCFLVAAAVRTRSRALVAGLLADVRPTVGPALVVSLMFFAFYVCIGQFQVRLSYSAVPPIAVALGVVATALADRLPATWRRSYAVACAAVAILTLAHGIAEGQHLAGDWFD